MGMGSELYIAIASLAVAVVVGVLMAMYPERRKTGWGVIAVSVASLFWSTNQFMIARDPASFPIAKVISLWSDTLAIVGLLLAGLGYLFFERARLGEAPGASVRIQFYGDNRLPVEIKSTNVANWFAYYSPHAEVRRHDSQSGAQEVLATAPKNWAVFISYDRPTEVRQIVVHFTAQGLPAYQVLQSSKRACLISFAGDIPLGELEIDVRA